jgi:hypothetical protein
MFEASDLDVQTTDGEIAVINLESARRLSWTRFFQNPLRVGVAETVIEHEQLTLQFLSDLSALDRLQSLVDQLLQMGDSASPRSALLEAQIASMTHRFADARGFLARAELGGAPTAEVRRLALNIDQACGANLDKVLDERRETARQSGRPEDLIVLGALLADLCEFTAADRTYRQALQHYRDVSPFPVAWAYFQLGVLWGELVPEPQTARAAQCYQKAIDCLPAYTKARVHLAEIFSSKGRASDAEVLLVPAITSGDPEVQWRLAEVMASQRKTAEAEAHMQAARSGFDFLLARHQLAFADHGAEFFVGSGNDCCRALELARVNVANRPTLRAFEQAHTIALWAGDEAAASELLAAATKHWNGTHAFQLSSLRKHTTEKREGAAA